MIPSAARARLGFAFAVSVTSLACGQHAVQPMLLPPVLVDSLALLQKIEAPGFVVSGVAATDDCKVWLAGASWGLIVEADPTSGESRIIGQLPGHLADTRLELADDHRLLAWSQESRVLMRIDTRNNRIREVAPPKHPWVGSAVGPSVPLGDGSIAVAPLGDQRIVRTPRPWQDAPIVWLLAGGDNHSVTIGNMSDKGGEFLTVADAQVRIGSAGDTLQILFLVDGVLERTMPWGGNSRLSTIHAGEQRKTDTVYLPRYFQAPDTWEDVWHAGWLINGLQPRVYQVAQFADAAFGPDGAFFAIRNGEAKWNAADTPLGKRMYHEPGGWEITRQWIEQYAADGRPLGWFALPSAGAQRLVVDGVGRLFIWGDDGSVGIFRDPSRSGQCGRPGPDMLIPFVDAPDAAPILGGADASASSSPD
ncbi:MAG TPA: hypothetical protein VJB15_10735 [Rhodothermia bacterium]|nr:hypothetical protein [Rhodothermia bacterium]